jgi:hypothetical protein
LKRSQSVSDALADAETFRLNGPYRIFPANYLCVATALPILVERGFHATAYRMARWEASDAFMRCPALRAAQQEEA